MLVLVFVLLALARVELSISSVSVPSSTRFTFISTPQRRILMETTGEETFSLASRPCVFAMKITMITCTDCSANVLTTIGGGGADGGGNGGKGIDSLRLVFTLSTFGGASTCGSGHT